MHNPIVIDIETQNTFQDVGHDPKKLKVSVVGVYDYASNQYLTFFEAELSRLFKLLEHATCIIGFNIDSFDLPVLSSYYLGNIRQFPTLDILLEVQKSLGYRISLDDLARSTLNIKKTGHGFLAVDLFKNKEYDKLKQYCLNDVRITKDLYEYGMKHGRLYFQTTKGDQEILVSFKSYNTLPVNVSLSLPF